MKGDIYSAVRAMVGDPLGNTFTFLPRGLGRHYGPGTRTVRVSRHRNPNVAREFKYKVAHNGIAFVYPQSTDSRDRAEHVIMSKAEARRRQRELKRLIAVKNGGFGKAA